jgi:hypothetical protein
MELRLALSNQQSAFSRATVRQTNGPQMNTKKRESEAKRADNQTCKSKFLQVTNPPKSFFRANYGPWSLLLRFSDHRITRSPDHPIFIPTYLRSSSKICG